MRLTDTGGIGPGQGVRTQVPQVGAGWPVQKKAGPAGAEEGTESVKLDLSEAAWEMLQRQAEAGREAAEQSEDIAADVGKVMEIARRIARGDQVPPRDEKKLMEYSDELYQMAKSAAMLSRLKKRRKHKSLFDEEEKNALEEKMRELSREESTVCGGAAPAGETGGDGEAGTDAEGS